MVKPTGQGMYKTGGLCLWTGTGLHIANEDRAGTEGKQPLALHLVLPKAG